MGKNRLLSVWRAGIAALAAGLVLGAAPAHAYEVLTPLLDGKNQINSRRAQSHLVIKAGKEEAGRLRVGRLAAGQGE